jgi:O-antigen/teichoic acid export membrane protein
VSSVLLVMYLFVWVWTMGFLITAMYLGAGMASIRRQLPMLALVAVGTLVTIAAVAILPGIVGEGGIFLLLIAANVMFFVWSRSRRNRPVPADPERLARARPALRGLAIVYVIGLAAAMVIVIVESSRPVA